MSCQSVMEVTSEILPYFERDLNSVPCLDSRNTISRFVFTVPQDSTAKPCEEPQLDADGDYVVARMAEQNVREETISLEHSVSTELSLVGLQIWRGALLLADFVIHHRDLFKNRTVLELGSGVGLTSVVAAMFCDTVICTDIDLGDILQLVEANFKRNERLLRATCLVRGLDFFQSPWSDDLEERLKDVSVVLAADVVYDNDVTEAFVRAIGRILSIPPKKSLYIAMEKRYVFTLSDLDSVAPCYEHLLTCLAEARASPSWQGWTLEPVALDFPQHFNYDRVPQLVMWKISS